MSVEDVRIFCQKPTQENWMVLGEKIQEYFIIASKYLLLENIPKSNVELALHIIDTFDNIWEYEIIEAGTILYRATKKPLDEASFFGGSDTPTYFAPSVYTCNKYLPAKKDGYMYIFRLKHNLQVFKFDSLYNINKLLMLQFYNMEDLDAFPGEYRIKKLGKIEIEQVMKYGKSYYDIIIEMFTGRSHVLKKNRPGTLGEKKEKKPTQLTRLLRKSVYKDDMAFVKELCNKFAGYNAGFIIRGESNWNYVPDDKKRFPPELMLCEPEKNVGEPIGMIRMKQETENLKNNEKLQNIVKKYGSGNPNDLIMSKILMEKKLSF